MKKRIHHVIKIRYFINLKNGKEFKGVMIITSGLKGERMSKAVIQLPHPSTYILDVLHEGFKHVDPDDSIRIDLQKMNWNILLIDF